jgi:hypothetical protein
MTSRFKAGCLIALAVVIAGGAGFILGVLSHQTWKKKSGSPEFIRWAVLRQIQQLEPDADQRLRLEAHVDRALDELQAWRHEAEVRTWDIIDRAADAVAGELTTEQVTRWQELRPKRPQKLQKSVTAEPASR